MKPFSRLVGAFGCRPCFHVIRTDLLADIAAKNVVANQGPQMAWNPALEFNRQVRNTTTSVENIRSYKRVRGTGLETQITPSTAVPNRPIISQRHTQEQLSEKKPRPSFRRNEMSVLADPA